MATYTVSLPFRDGTVNVQFDGVSLCDFHLIVKQLEDSIVKRVSESPAPIVVSSPRPIINMTLFDSVTETTPESTDAMIAASTEIAGMDRYNNHVLMGYPLSAKDSKFETRDEAIQAFRKCIKNGIKVGGITFQKCGHKWIWSLRSNKSPVREPNAAKVDTTYSWIPRNFEQYEQHCRQEEEPPCYDGSDGRVTYNSLEETYVEY